MKHKNWLIYAQLALGMALFGSGTPISKIVTDAFPIFVAALMRVSVATAILLPLTLSQHDFSKIEKRDWWILGGVAVIGMFLFSVFMLYGMRMVSGVVGAVVMSTTPAVTAAAAFFMFHDHLGWRKITAIVLAVVGVLVLQLSDASADSSQNILLGSLLIFGAVCSEASFTLFGKAASDNLSPLMITAAASAIAIVLFLPFALYQLWDFDFSQPQLSDWIALGWWGLGTLGLGSVLWYTGVKQVQGSTAAGFMGVMPVSALVLSYILLGEAFQWVHIIGFGIVFSGVLMIIRSHWRQSRHENG